MTPDLLILGQITIDHVVPALPGPWREALGGNALYAAAGARLWIDPARIGVVARRGRNAPNQLEAMMAGAGLTAAGLAPASAENIVEWMLYETDGSRRNIPRAPELRAPNSTELYLDRKAAVSAEADDIPPAWRANARAVHLAPQVRDKHPRALAALRAKDCVISVDPSPAYARALDLEGLAERLSGAAVFLPSQAEVSHLSPSEDWPGLAARLVAAGFPEVAIKLGSRGVVLCAVGDSRPELIPAAPAKPVDLTGAGDSFSGAYLANRLLGRAPAEAARRAVVSAAMVVECVGVDAALALDGGNALRDFQAMERSDRAGRA